jgi:cell division protein FtsN
LLVSTALLLSLVAAYLVFQSRSAVPQSQKAEVSSEQAEVESASAVAPTQAANAIKPASDDAEKADAEKSDAEKGEAEKASPASSEAPANVVAETQWRHALQALASSSEAEANLFAAKLVSAGIPAYVIPADIERRGKWYRVRIGGFNTAQEAQRFIADARLRAKAAGINLKDLNVVDYERP